jgi:hypothetical protein
MHGDIYRLYRHLATIQRAIDPRWNFKQAINGGNFNVHAKYQLLTIS